MPSIGAQRLAAQQVARPTCTTPAELVAWMGAIQAQDYLGCKWAVGLRLREATEATIDRALAEGTILRTHAFRWTWQLIVPADVRWMLALVAPRLEARAAGRHRELELDAATFRRSRTVFEKALRGGRHLTRRELAAVLERAGIATTGQRLPHLLGHAELQGLLTSGAPRGKQQTFALLDERAPPAAPRPRDEALAELARRYFTSRAPATAEDFAWWAGLTLTEARAARAALQLSEPPPARPSPTVHLLPPFDELLVSYKDRTAVLDRPLNDAGGMLDAVVVAGGRVAGRWRRTLGRGAVRIELDLFADPSPALMRAIGAAARRYAAFLGLEAELVRATRPRTSSRRAAPSATRPRT